MPEKKRAARRPKMIRAKGNLRTALGVVFCFFAAVLLAAAAYNLGIVTEPGKILPAEITMRSGETNRIS